MTNNEIVNLQEVSNILQTNEESMNLLNQVDKVYDLEGDYVECGVFQGKSAYMIYHKMNLSKKLFLIDSFLGVFGDEQDKEAWIKGRSNFETEVRNLFIDKKNCHLIKGYFPQCVTEEMNKSKFCFVHLDMDNFDATLEGLRYFWPKMSTGGVIVLHDYANPGTMTKEACDFFSRTSFVKYGLLPGNTQAIFKNND